VREAAAAGVRGVLHCYTGSIGLAEVAIAGGWYVSFSGIVTFKVTDDGGKLALQPGWTSRDIPSPLPPLVINGVMFTASSGTKAVPSVLYAIDAATGKELWSSLRAITTSVRSGLSAGQGNVYLPGADGTLYAFGFGIEK